MTLIYELDLKMPNVHLYTKMNLLVQRVLQLTDRQTDRHRLQIAATERIITPHSRVVKIYDINE